MTTAKGRLPSRLHTIRHPLLTDLSQTAPQTLTCPLPNGIIVGPVVHRLPVQAPKAAVILLEMSLKPMMLAQKDAVATIRSNLAPNTYPQELPVFILSLLFSFSRSPLIQPTIKPSLLVFVYGTTDSFNL